MQIYITWLSLIRPNITLPKRQKTYMQTHIRLTFPFLHHYHRWDTISSDSEIILKTLPMTTAHGSHNTQWHLRTLISRTGIETVIPVSEKSQTRGSFIYSQCCCAVVPSDITWCWMWVTRIRFWKYKPYFLRNLLHYTVFNLENYSSPWICMSMKTSNLAWQHNLF